MPIGAFKLNSIAKFTVTAVAEVIRKNIGISAVGNAKTSTAQSKFGGSSYLGDGTGDYLVLGNTSSLSSWNASNFTIEYWIRPNAMTSFQSTPGATAIPNIIGNMSATGSLNYWSFGPLNNGSVRFFYYNGAEQILTTTGVTLTINTWYHLAFVRNGSNIKIYVDGVERASGTISGTPQYDGSVNFSIAQYNNVSMNGYIDEVRVSNSARYTSAFTPSTTPFTNDDNTLLLLHMDSYNNSTFFEDDNGIRSPKSITANGNARISTSRSKFGGSSAYFDGASDSLVIKENFSFAAGQDFTIEFWVNEDIIQNAKYIAGQTAGDIFIGHDTAVYSNRLGVGIVNVGWYADFGMSLAADTWYHVAISRSGTNVYYFVDGVLKLTQTSGTLTTAEWKFSGMQIGAELTTFNTPLNGYIDEVRVSNSARYTSAFTPSTTPFVNDANTLLLLHMDGTNSHIIFRDDVGVRAPNNIQVFGNAQISTAQSKFGGASALFDGTGDYLQIPKSTALTLTSQSTWTVEMWVRFADIGVLRGLIGQQTGGNVNNYGWGLYRDASNRILWYSGAGTFVTTTGFTSAANTWYHVAVVRNGTSMKIFVNGTQYYTTSSYANSTDSTADIVVGFARDYASGLWSTVIFYQNGYIDEVRISNSARYTANFTAPTAAFQNDANTVLLIHADGSNTNIGFTDDNGRTPT